jgi:hypothetical protein
VQSFAGSCLLLLHPTVTRMNMCALMRSSFPIGSFPRRAAAAAALLLILSALLYGARAVSVRASAPLGGSMRDMMISGLTFE